MRDYAEQGKNLIIGEVFGRTRRPQGCQRLPRYRFSHGSSFGPVAPNFLFDNWIHEPSYLSGMVAGATTKTIASVWLVAMPFPKSIA